MGSKTKTALNSFRSRQCLQIFFLGRFGVLPEQPNPLDAGPDILTKRITTGYKSKSSRKGCLDLTRQPFDTLGGTARSMAAALENVSLQRLRPY